MFWFFGGLKFAHKKEALLPSEHFSHETPLLRKLKDVEMYLQYNKIINLRIAVPKLNKITIYPGEVFSYWKLIGKPTRRKGYQHGMILRNGTVTEGTGGGLCQLSNLIYWLTIHTPLTVIERHRHGYDVFPDANRTQPFGSGATCFYNYGDLIIRNDTKQVFQLIAEITETHLKGAWVSNKPPLYMYEVYEKEHIMQSEYWGGYTRHNILYRKKYDLNGSVVDDEFVVENHAIMMYSPFLSEQTS
jgi:vancomycin resistance protein VanW